MSERPSVVDVLGVSVAVWYVSATHPRLGESFGTAYHEPGETAIYVNGNMKAVDIRTTLFHERLELALMMLGIRDNPDDIQEVIIRVAEMLSR